VALPVPDAADTISQLTLLAAFHPQPAGAVIAMLTVAPALGTDVVVGTAL
jgi:hypothetical protein